MVDSSSAHRRGEDTRYAVDIRVFVSVIVIAMAVSFGVGVGLGPNGQIATTTTANTNHPAMMIAPSPALPPVTSVKVTEADAVYDPNDHSDLHEPAGQVRTTKATTGNETESNVLRMSFVYDGEIVSWRRRLFPFSNHFSHLLFCFLLGSTFWSISKASKVTSWIRKNVLPKPWSIPSNMLV
jgi:hypothetical protein